ncbi:MAG: DUF2709 domain-containing protein [Chlamydiales bacterium]
MTLSAKLKKEIFTFLQKQRSPELLVAYFFYLEKHFKLHPVAFVHDKKIFQSVEDAIAKLEAEGKVWRETEIKIGYGPASVNEETSRIYICPFTGKVFADNTHPNPQDAIYDWVSKCPENTERVGGVRAKRFFVSDDKEVIQNYIKPPKEPISKIVFSSAITGKLYNSKEAVIRDFKQNYLKPMTLVEVQNQNRFELEDGFLHFVQEHLDENKIAGFVEELADDETFLPYVSKWVEA